ncbi:MAG: thiamine phosphate synthase [bacterium]
MTRLPSGIYAIVNPGMRLDVSAVELARRALSAGVRVIQLRAKNMAAGEMCELARKMTGLCREHDGLFIVNDRLDVALAADAHGVHVGQDDLPLEAARRLAPEDFVIGVSTHSLEEARQAENAGADYIGFGAMYETLTKEDVTPPRGKEGLAEVVASVSVPVIAIGGIKAEHIKEIKEAGVAGAAVISALISRADPQAAARELVHEWEAA